jgi:hypothetical protein
MSQAYYTTSHLQEKFGTTKILSNYDSLVKVGPKQTEGEYKYDESKQTYSTILSEYDPRSPIEVKTSVQLLLQKWGHNTFEPIAPDVFLGKLLSSRGYSCATKSALAVHGPRRIPCTKQIEDYDNGLIASVRNSDYNRLVDFYNEGRHMTSCNKFSESIIHMACRRSHYNIVQFLLLHGGDFSIVDDYGRTPLHDACWRTEPAFDIVTLLLDSDNNAERLLYMDARGSVPLQYVRQDHWMQWCVYLYHQKEKYWPIRGESASL